jgi:hypothetical protein
MEFSFWQIFVLIMALLVLLKMLIFTFKVILQLWKEEE